MPAANPLVSDRNIDFLLYEVFDAPALCELPHFEDHSRETFDMFLGMCRKYAREELFATYKPMDEEAAHFEGGRIKSHPAMESIYPQLVELGIINATRPYEVEGQQLPASVFAMAQMYLNAANLSAISFAWLTAGAAHLIEAFGSEDLKKQYMEKMYIGEWTGTMALTEPGAGSGLADLKSKAIPTDEGHYLVSGSKVFISGADQTFTENVVHLALARIEGAPEGVKGISLFAIPKLRVENGSLVDNDCSIAGTFHKMGYRGIPSAALNFGEKGDCHGFLVGEPHFGLKYMFQMMNEARISVGGSATATATVAYQESLLYAQERLQGRAIGQSPSEDPIPIIRHADVRRMLLRQKAITEGALALVFANARYADLAEHSTTQEDRDRAFTLCDLLTPITKSFPSEWGFESNALAVQVLGGYGYSGEYLPESWLRDQKLNSIHEGTSGIQSMDLLGRKIMRTQGQSLVALNEEIERDLVAAEEAGVDAEYITALRDALGRVIETTTHLGGIAMSDPEAMMRHSFDYMSMLSIVVIAWQWILQATATETGLKGGANGSENFYEGKRHAVQYWFAAEMPKVAVLANMITAGDDSFATMQPEFY